MAMMFDRPDSSLTRIRRSLPTSLGSDVLVACGDARDGMDVHPAFVGERAGADERLVGAKVHVGRFVDEPRQLGQMLDARRVAALRSPASSAPGWRRPRSNRHCRSVRRGR